MILHNCFFFQAEDGIRDHCVTGVQTCALPIFRFAVPGAFARTVVELRTVRGWVSTYRGVPTIVRSTRLADLVDRRRVPDVFGHYVDRLAIECALTGHRSEERRVGRECRSTAGP